MEEVLCAMALKSANGRQNHHTLSALCVCRGRALKSAGERNTHGGVGAGAFGKPPARGAWRGSAWHESGELAARLMLRRQITDRKYRLALRAAATKSASRSWRTYTPI
jgi:hypothetical protein